MRELTCLGACGSYGCCTPALEGWSPHPQGPETHAHTQQGQIKTQKLTDH